MQLGLRAGALPSGGGHGSWCTLAAGALTLLTAGVVFLSFVGTVAADEARSEGSPDARTEPIERGFVLLGGKEIPAPFVVARTRAGVTLNGYEVQPSGRRGGRLEGRRPPRRGRTGAADHGMRGFSQLKEALRCSGLILLSPDGAYHAIYGRLGLKVLEILTSDAYTEAKLNDLVAMQAAPLSSGEWRTLVDGFEPSAGLEDRMQAARERFDAAVLPTCSSWASVLLTLLALLLAVVALGTLLMHRPDVRQGIRGRNPHPQATRFVVQAVLLLAILSVYDLVATVVLVRQGLVFEINPLAEGLIHRPLLATLFKVALTGLGAVLLVSLRRYRVAQVGAWWCCVIYTVLLFRWATVASSLAL